MDGLRIKGHFKIIHEEAYDDIGRLSKRIKSQSKKRLDRAILDIQKGVNNDNT